MKPHDLRSEESPEPADELTPGSSSAGQTVDEGKGISVAPQQAATIQTLPHIPPILLEGDQPAGAPAAALQNLTTEPSTAGSETQELPEAYGTGKVLLAAQDPHSLYAHWDLTSDQNGGHAARVGEQGLVVKVYRQNQPEQPLGEIPVSTEKRHAFVHVDFAGESYVAELGYYATGREWKALSVSDPVPTPVESVAEDRPIQFATHLLEEPSAMGPGKLTTDLAQARSPDRTLSEPQPVRANLPAFLTQAAPVGGAGQFPPEDPWLQKAAMSGPSEPELRIEPTQEQPSPVSDWTAAHDQALAELIGWNLMPHATPASAQIPEILRGRADRSSPSGGELPGRQGFWFNIEAELVIYGATEPNAQVTVSAQPVELRPDGTFSFRVALPDGQHAFSAAAYSAEGEVRRAEMEFQRNTRHYGQAGV